MRDAADRGAQLRHGACLLVDRMLAWVPHPRARGRVLRLLGAQIGQNVRVHDTRFINLETGFTHLRIADDVHVGTDCLLDLSEVVSIGNGAVLGPRVCVLTHQDAGAHHGAPVAAVLGTFERPTEIGPGAFVGAASTILCGVHVGAHAVVAAGSVVTTDVAAGTVVAGVPAKHVRSIRDELLAAGVEFAPTPLVERARSGGPASVRSGDGRDGDAG